MCSLGRTQRHRLILKSAELIRAQLLTHSLKLTILRLRQRGAEGGVGHEGEGETVRVGEGVLLEKASKESPSVGVHLCLESSEWLLEAERSEWVTTVPPLRRSSKHVGEALHR